MQPVFKYCKSLLREQNLQQRRRENRIQATQCRHLTPNYSRFCRFWLSFSVSRSILEVAQNTVKFGFWLRNLLVWIWYIPNIESRLTRYEIPQTLKSFSPTHTSLKSMLKPHKVTHKVQFILSLFRQKYCHSIIFITWKEMLDSKIQILKCGIYMHEIGTNVPYL